jgi:hypothetical protein
MTGAPKNRRSWGHVRRLPSGRFQASYIGPDLKRNNARITFTAKEDAEAWLDTQSRTKCTWWRSDDPDYTTAHKRVKRQRGHPQDHRCVDCGERQEQQWSYDYNDPSPKVNPRTGCPYSTDIDRYEPRCRRCHKAFDAQRALIGDR